MQEQDIVVNIVTLTTTDGKEIVAGSYFRVNKIERTNHPNKNINAVSATLEVTGTRHAGLVGKTVQLDKADFFKVSSAASAL